MLDKQTKGFHLKCIFLKGQTKMKMDEEKLNDFLNKKEFTLRHVRCILVGCGGALLRRLQNAKFKDLMNIKTTELVDVHVNIFDVLENENTIQGNFVHFFIEMNATFTGGTSVRLPCVVTMPIFLH